MNTFITLLRRPLSAMLLLAVCGLPGTASAAVFTWNGGGANSTWSTTANWSNGSAPTTGSDLLFNNSTRTSPNVNNIGGLTLPSISFVNGAGAFTISGSAINLGSITNTSLNNQTLSLGVIQSTSGTYDATSNITLSGSLTGSGDISKTGAGSLVLSGNTKSGYTGTINVTTGTLSFVSNASLAGGGVKLEAGTTFASTASTTSLKSLELAGAGITLPNSGITFQFNSGSFSNTSGTAYSIDNAVTFLNTSSLNAGAGLTMNGAIGGSGTLTKTGAGTLELANSSNGFSGTLNLNEGKLKLAGGMVGATVAAAAGTEVATAASTTSYQLNSLAFAAGAASNLSPGDAGGLGGFASSSDITLSANTNVNFDIQGSGDGTSGFAVTDYDSVTFAANGSGTLTYAGFLNLNFLGSNAFENGTVFQLFDSSGFGSFLGDLDGVNTTTTDSTSSYANLSFTDYAGASAFDIAYFNLVAGDWISDWNGNQQRLVFSQSTGTLTVVPEPSTIVFAGIGMAMFGWSTWTRRRANARRQAIEAAIA